ncbi:hypothetical protein [Pandoraea cepalis]|uniref:hypothetical protein n=1 Tax=Pandoraea cepalis TaxID=2508294 RepID=UPI00263A945F|nr:hypothetical protein [Pandoraea cepalis]
MIILLLFCNNSWSRGRPVIWRGGREISWKCVTIRQNHARFMWIFVNLCGFFLQLAHNLLPDLTPNLSPDSAFSRRPETPVAVPLIAMFFLAA